MQGTRSPFAYEYRFHTGRVAGTTDRTILPITYLANNILWFLSDVC